MVDSLHERSNSARESLSGYAGRLTFDRYLAVCGGVIVLLFTALAPSASAGLGPLGRGFFWLLHTVGALVLLSLLQRTLDRRPVWRRHPFLATTLAGVLGAWAFAPVGFLIETWMGMAEAPDGDGLDIWADEHGLLGGLTAEAIEMTLPISLTWLAINLPWLLRLNFQPMMGPEDPTTEGAPQESPLYSASPPKPTTAPQPPESLAATPDPTPRPSDFANSLPTALGTDVIALSSQLHYLEVHTVRGRALVLYNLRDAVSELEARISGLQIHRSHWVADPHVRRMARRGNRWICELSNGLELPVSRRRLTEAKRRWGTASFRERP